VRPKTITLTIVCAVAIAGLLERLASISFWRIKVHRRKRKQHVLMLLIAVTWLGLAGTVTPVRSQDLVCCDMFISSDGSWFGARRDCKAALEELSQSSRAKACAQIRSSKPPIFRPFRYSASRSGCFWKRLKFAEILPWHAPELLLRTDQNFRTNLLVKQATLTLLRL
jgi:hypothetical protein